VLVLVIVQQPYYLQNNKKMRSAFQTEFDVLEQEETLVIEQKERSIVVYNDDVNTFDFVIETLIRYCGHETEQATQCTYLIHYKGKCAVKNGSFKSLKPICEALLESGLTAKIEN
jgi:ATP-dependent Clp protease adaptor protein ClpS